MFKITKLFAIMFALLFTAFTLNAGQTTTNVTVFATATIGSSPMSLTVNIVLPGRSAGLDFGTVLPNPSNMRFQATNRVEVSYFAGSNPTWYLYVSSQNYSSLETDGGLKGVVSGQTNYLPLKVWCANFGPTGFGNGSNPPYDGSEDDTYLWGGMDLNSDGDKDDVLTTGTYSESTFDADFNGDGDKTDTWNTATDGPIEESGAGWNWVWDVDLAENDPGLTKRVLCKKVGALDASLPSPFNSYYGIDVAGAASADYDTQLVFEMDINEE